MSSDNPMAGGAQGATPENQQERLEDPPGSRESSETIRQPSPSGDEEMVRTLWRHREAGRNDRPTCRASCSRYRS